MYVVSVFEHSLPLELALNELEKKGILKAQILAIPLDSKDQAERFFDTIHGSDGISLFDLAAALATIGMVLGVIYGFVLKGGPVIWGLLGTVGGFCLGLTIDFFIDKRKKRQRSPNRTAEVVVLVDCEDADADLIKRIFQENFALGIAKVN
jgi:hypothetical protein